MEGNRKDRPFSENPKRINPQVGEKVGRKAPSFHFFVLLFKNLINYIG